MSAGHATKAELRVCLSGLEAPVGPALVAAFGALGAKLALIESDPCTAQGASIERLASTGRPGVLEALEALGGIDTFVRQSRCHTLRPLLDVTRDEWRRDVGRVFDDAFDESSAVAEWMAKHSGGSIVHILSVDAIHAYPGRVTAAGAMAGLLGLTRALAVELAGAGVRANAVVAGPLAGHGAQAPPEVVKRTLQRSPAHRLGQASDVASAVIFLSSSAASFMTGQTLRVDGGWTSLNSATDWSKADDSMCWTS